MADNSCCGESQSILEKYPQKRRLLDVYLDSLPLNGSLDRGQGFLIQSLHKAQEIFGYLPLEVQELVGKKLRLQQSDVFGVISFYSYFTTKPLGKHKISVCTGTACFVKGADKILSEFKSRLGIEEAQTTPDNMHTLACIRCVGACSLAPVVTVNERVYGNVTPKMVASILKDCQ